MERKVTGCNIDLFDKKLKDELKTKNEKFDPIILLTKNKTKEIFQ